MFVKDWKRWKGGCEFLSMLDGDDGGGNFDSDKVVSPLDITIHNQSTEDDDVISFYGDYAGENRTSINFYPALLNYSYHPNQQAPYQFGANSTPDGGDIYTTTDNNYRFEFYMDKDYQGDAIGQQGYNYFVIRHDYTEPPFVNDTYYLGAVNPDIDGSQFIGLYLLPDDENKPYDPRGGLKFKIKMGSNLLKQDPIGTNTPTFSVGIPGGANGFDTVGQFTLTGTSATAAITMTSEIVHNGLPYLEVGSDTNCGGRTGREEPIGGRDARHFNNEYTAIPRYFPLATNIAIDENDILGREDFVKTTMTHIKNYFRLNEIYVGSKTTYAEQRRDIRNWFVELDLGFHNDCAVGAYAGEPIDMPDDATQQKRFLDQGDIAGFTFWDQWFSPLKRSKTGGDDIGGREANIFSMGRYKVMGDQYQSNEQKIRVFSRFQPDLFENNIHTLNSYVGTVNEDTMGDSLMGLSPNIEVIKNYDNFYDQTKKFDICLVPMEYYNANGENPQCCGFVNFQETYKGDGGEAAGGMKGFFI